MACGLRVPGFRRLLNGCQPDKQLPHQENSCDPKSPIPGGLRGLDMQTLEPKHSQTCSDLS